MKLRLHPGGKSFSCGIKLSFPVRTPLMRVLFPVVTPRLTYAPVDQKNKINFFIKQLKLVMLFSILPDSQKF